MTQVIFNVEWIVAAKLAEKTGLSNRQMKALRQNKWIEGVHFKRAPMTGEDKQRALIWYNYPRINQLIQES